MKKLIKKVQLYFIHKAYQESSEADEFFAAEEQYTSDTIDNTQKNINIGEIPNDVITALKKAHKEVQEFEQTLISIKQNAVV